MRRWLLVAIGLAWLAPPPARAVDPTPRCIATKLGGAARTVERMGECAARALRDGGLIEPRCLVGARRPFRKAYQRVEEEMAGFCRRDDGLERAEVVLGRVVLETARDLAPPSGGSRCAAAKLRAAAARAAATLVANAKALPGPMATNPVHRRARKLAQAVRVARRTFRDRFRRIERAAACATDVDPEVVGAAVDARLDGFSAVLNVVTRETVSLPSPVDPPNTPGTAGVTVTNPKLMTQFGGDAFSLNNVTYTRWRLAGPPRQPDAILVTVPGFGGGAGNFEVLAENLVTRMQEDHALIVEVWGYDRRSEQLEDREGALRAGELGDPLVALDWFYGAELGFTLHAPLTRRAVFYNTSDDVPFLANWTPLVFSRDIDVVVRAASTAANAHVFLGGHSAGTGFAARYAATDLNVSGDGPPDPGYRKLRGLVLFEGGGGSTATAPLTDDALDRIVAKHDGGLFGAVRDGAPRCVDGTTPCTIATEAVDCAGQTPPKCTPSGPAHGVILGISPKILASAEPTGIQGLGDPDGGQAIVQVDQGAPGNNAIAKVPELALLTALGPGTVEGLFGSFLDDDGFAAALSPAIAASVGAPGPTVGGLITWLDQSERASFPPCPGTGCVTPDNGPPPAEIPASGTGFWGLEKEVVRLDRLRTSFAGVEGANASDWYYPISGLGVTTAPGLCDGGTCAAGNAGASCGGDGDCTQSISLDSTALSVGRGRRDIESLTEAANIDIPVLCIGGSNGLASVPARFLPFARSIAPCATPACAGTARILDETSPSAAFPTFGGIAGGFEVVIAEGFAHIDVVAAEDDADNPILPALAAFIARNVDPD